MQLEPRCRVFVRPRLEQAKPHENDLRYDHTHPKI